MGASAAVALWPELIRRAFADASFDATGGRKTAPGLAAAQGRARAAGRPLFVIVVPADDTQKYARGRLWGEYLNHGGAAGLAPLAGVEVSCATMQELAALAPDVVGEPLAVVVELDGRARALDATYPEQPLGRRASAVDGEGDPTGRRIAALSTMVLQGLPTIAPSQARAAADRVIRTLRTAAPSGSHWANASGCGPATVEGMADDESVGYGCGMGHVPEKSRRFLYFFAKSPQQLEREWLAAQTAHKAQEKR